MAAEFLEEEGEEERDREREMKKMKMKKEQKHALLEFDHRTRKFKDTFVFTLGRWMVPT